jgi:hypothetical protein
MDLSQLVEKISQERSKYITKVRLATRGLTFEDVTKYIKFDPRNMEYADFEEGKPFEFILFQGWMNVSVMPNITGVGFSDTALARFEGEKPGKYYRSLVAAVKKAREDGAFDLPF